METAEEFHARVLAACDDERRLPVAVEDMPGWDIFPFELSSLRIKPLEPLADAEPDRRGEDPATCWCAASDVDDSSLVWSDERWRLSTLGMRIPVGLSLSPREHCDLVDVPEHLQADLGRLMVTISAVVETVPSVGRSHVAKYGDGGAHLHLFFFGRPARMLQLRGSPMLDWEENLPPLPDEVARANVTHVVDELVRRAGGNRGPWLG
jgi:hypothetical protein